MIINGKNKVIYFEDRVATPEETSHLPINSAQVPGRTFITNINGEIYFAKSEGVYGLTNELIGSYLSKKIGLDTVDYQIGKTDKSFFALSKPFYEDGYDYFYLKEYFNIPNESKKSSLSNFRFFPKSLFQALLCSTEGLDLIRETPVYDSVLKLIAVDLKMGQFDRHGGNLQVKVGESAIPSVAPIYDYGYSYVLKDQENTFTYCCSYLVWVRRNKKSLNELVRRHPKLMDYLEQLLEIPMYTILDDICDEKGIEYTSDEFYKYIRSQRLIDRTLNKVKIK